MKSRFPSQRHAWQHSFQPRFEFYHKGYHRPLSAFFCFTGTTKSTTITIYTLTFPSRAPGQDTAQKFHLDLQLATNEKGWEATGMDDIYEHRIELASPKFLKAGNYKFTLEQIMRENPLQNVVRRRHSH